jgi:TPR repeat protein
MRRIVNLLAVFFLIHVLTACTNVIGLSEGIESFKAQDYRRAFIRLKPEAEKGQPDAQYAVGYMYYYGQGVIEDRKKAWFWINMAAQLGQKDAIEAVKLLQLGSLEKKRVFESTQLRHYPIHKEMY